MNSSERFLQALRHEQTDVARRLLDEDPDLSRESIFTASGAGDIAAAIARSILADHPDLIRSLGPEDKGAMSDAVWNDRADAIRLMVDLGFDLSWGAVPKLTVADGLSPAEISREIANG